MSERGGKRSGRGGGRGGPMPRNVQVSKKMSWLLRHGAEKEGLKLDSGGFINVQDVLNNRNLKSLKVTFDELKACVADNDKQRFTMVPISDDSKTKIDAAEGTQSSPLSPDDPSQYLIRANQGHSLKVESEGLLKPITEENMPSQAIHGTTHSAYIKILASGGLKPMTRNHVHFASGIPAGFKSVVDVPNAEDAAAPVISGMRNSSTILIYLDLQKAMQSGIKFWLSDNGVILSEGNANGLVPVEVFKRVEDRTGAGVLVADGEIVKEAPAAWGGKTRDKSAA
ncbi:tRNA 2'-phosphotransferase 1 [Cercospora beticola]|uniref:2'-phosphotransferase n=1 Tax=Cercospora beticola TaxID=122368 RepID=A0A2G5IAI8_CERBT|nr:tRNA 2'-phosphotransferase 1 [Cercospora beticola]PIB01799.1 tRNA 2'-phosphotransferase 1 [Cercospora beticola]WPA96675.1 hypothetical protein RHO25_001283 [Cercospora beticola]CAK1354971.1 unnamed protein product [Cercospora beticola]